MLLGLATGIVIGLLVEPILPVSLQPYLPITIMAALDATPGGARAWLEGAFSDRVFMVSSLSNVFVTGLAVFTDDQIGVGSQLSTGVVVVLGTWIFNNTAAIRRTVLHA